ncbi:MAG: hypothetical protein N3F63_02945 [Thermoplasmata archaeon]|nr:hypothetical protein [Thermoplasmata archaeon]
MSLKTVVDSYMQKVAGLEAHCERCLATNRWHGSVVLMVIDAAFTSIGLNYFTAVVPKVIEFDRKFVSTGKIGNLRGLAEVEIGEIQGIWKNRRSLRMAREIAAYLSRISGDDRAALRQWASQSSLEHWEEDPVGRINGVGLVTYQYLRMMGGIDTVMPDKIVKRVINEILVKAGEKPVYEDIAFIKKCDEIAGACGYRAIELCWMTWLVQEQGKVLRMEKYREILGEI